MIITGYVQTADYMRSW